MKEKQQRRMRQAPQGRKPPRKAREKGVSSPVPPLSSLPPVRPPVFARAPPFPRLFPESAWAAAPALLFLLSAPRALSPPISRRTWRASALPSPLSAVLPAAAPLQAFGQRALFRVRKQPTRLPPWPLLLSPELLFPPCRLPARRVFSKSPRGSFLWKRFASAAAPAAYRPAILSLSPHSRIFLP